VLQVLFPVVIQNRQTDRLHQKKAWFIFCRADGVG
jgi:hypothetical protein